MSEDFTQGRMMIAEGELWCLPAGGVQAGRGAELGPRRPVLVARRGRFLRSFPRRGL
jgi:hypothetical protein